MSHVKYESCQAIEDMIMDAIKATKESVEKEKNAEIKKIEKEKNAEIKKIKKEGKAAIKADLKMDREHVANVMLEAENKLGVIIQATTLSESAIRKLAKTNGYPIVL